jgi:flagellar biosynthesis/type III secretory pathway protein FliH
LAEHWKKVIIFAAQTVKTFPLNIIVQATFFYMVHVSQTVNKKAKNYEKEFTPEEQSLLPFLPEFLADSFKKGKEEGKAEGIVEGKAEGKEEGKAEVLLAYITKNPMQSNKQIADIFDVTVSFVEQLRKKLK